MHKQTTARGLYAEQWRDLCACVCVCVCVGGGGGLRMGSLRFSTATAHSKNLTAKTFPKGLSLKSIYNEALFWPTNMSWNFFKDAAGANINANHIYIEAEQNAKNCYFFSQNIKK